MTDFSRPAHEVTEHHLGSDAWRESGVTQGHEAAPAHHGPGGSRARHSHPIPHAVHTDVYLRAPCRMARQVLCVEGRERDTQIHSTAHVLSQEGPVVGGSHGQCVQTSHCQKDRRGVASRLCSLTSCLTFCVLLNLCFLLSVFVGVRTSLPSKADEGSQRISGRQQLSKGRFRDSGDWPL